MKELGEIFAEYQDLRSNYRNYTKNGEGIRDVLIEFQGRFNDIKAELTFWKSKYLNEYVKRDDKYLTSFKARIVLRMSKGEFSDSDGTKFDKMSISTAEKIAGGTKMYSDLIDSRAEFKEYYTNITDVRDDIVTFINEIKDRIR